MEKLGAEDRRFCWAFVSHSVFDEAVGQYIWVNIELNLYFRETSLWAGSLPAQIAPACCEIGALFLTSCWKLRNLPFALMYNYRISLDSIPKMRFISWLGDWGSVIFIISVSQRKGLSLTEVWCLWSHKSVRD